MSAINKQVICEYKLAADEEMIFNSPSAFSFVFVKEGTGTLRLNNSELEYCPGTTVIMSCVDFLKKNITETHTTMVVFTFSDEIFRGHFLEFFSITELPLCTFFDSDREKIETLLRLISESCNSNAINNSIFSLNLAKELLIYTIRNHRSDIGNSIRDIKTELAVLYIYSHFKQSVSLEETAAYVHFSSNYFYHSFQKNTGISFQKFLHNLRLDYAMNLICYTDLSICDICFECGYNSAQYFSTSFRKKFGKSPKNFIKNKHKGELK